MGIDGAFEGSGFDTWGTCGPLPEAIILVNFEIVTFIFDAQMLKNRPSLFFC